MYTISESNSVVKTCALSVFTPSGFLTDKLPNSRFQQLAVLRVTAQFHLDKRWDMVQHGAHGGGVERTSLKKESRKLWNYNLSAISG
jgi:hypothetical protein